MPRFEIFRFQVHFGDCDPAGIAFYPNFFRWYDAASRHFFDRCGLPTWRETEKESGIIGVPLVEARSRFIKPVTYGDLVEIHTHVSTWEEKRFIQTHELRHGNDVVAVGEETRVFARRDAQTGRIYSIPIPPEFRAIFEAA
ncbi:MAG: acyl-CoA thioesterase [Myxococcales bacterium]|nr:acyl-CoA thioesterase [Myxococcales bacterium]